MVKLLHRMNAMSLKGKTAKNVTATWASLFVHLAVGFFLSPYILHRLGDDAFGVWVLVFSLTGYYGLLDLGIRQSVVRYVAKFAATDDKDQLARFVNTCIFAYSIISILVLLATGLCALYLPVLFRIPPNLLHPARIVVVLVGIGVALTFPLSVFAGILSGVQEFFRPHTAQIGFTLMRGLLIVMVLSRGGGLLGITAVTVGLNVLSYAVMFFMVPRTLLLRFGIRFINRRVWSSIMHYSSLAFLIVVADKLRFQSDAVVIGMLASSGAVTYFAIGSRLVEYSGMVVQGLSQIFAPMSSQFDATGDLKNLRKVFIIGNRACAMTIFPICAVLIILGKPIIEAWVGAKYLSSYSILLLLLLPKTLYLAQAGSVKVLLGTGRHRPLATVLALEGVANLILSLILIRHLGILGVALGTAIPLTCTSLFYLPSHLCRQLNVRLSSYLREAYLLPLGLCVPLVTVLLSIRPLFPMYQYSSLFLQVSIGGVVYTAGLLLFFFMKEPTKTVWLAKIRAIRQELLSG